MNSATPRRMKLVLLAIIAFHLANFGDANPPLFDVRLNGIGWILVLDDNCDCANLWIQNTLDFFGLSNPVPRQLANKIEETWGNSPLVGGREVNSKY